MQINILVVEDAPDWRKKLKAPLEEEGYTVQTVSSFAEALEALQEKNFSLAIIDIRLDMPRSTEERGLEVLAYIAEHARRTKTIVLTGYGSIPQAIEVREKYGVFAYLNKQDLDPLELIALVKKALAYQFQCFKTGGDCSRRDITLKPNQVFIAMPFSSDKINMDNVLFGISSALQEVGYEPFRADEVFLGKDLMCNICKHIQESLFNIVDISDWNPNVLLELGMMYGWGRPVILLKYKGSDTKVPADLRAQLYFEYDDNWKSLIDGLTKILKDLGY